MTSIQIKNVPEDVHRVLRERAARNHQSLQEYLLAYLIAEAKQRTLDEIFDEVERNGGNEVSTAEITAIIRADRDSR